jgi:parallel beta-helix repeat protein
MIRIDGNADNNRILSCVFNGYPSATSSNHVGVHADQDSIDNTIISDNIFNDGGYGIALSGYSASYLSSGTEISNNTFTSQGWGGVYLGNQDAPLITGNTVTGAGQRGFELTSCDNGIVVTKNRLSVNSSYGLYFNTSIGGTGLPVARGLIANNFVSGSLQYGMYLYSVTNQDIYHNSVNVTGTGTAMYTYAGSGNSVNVVNNIFSASGGGLA